MSTDASKTSWGAGATVSLALLLFVVLSIFLGGALVGMWAVANVFAGKCQ